MPAGIHLAIHVNKYHYNTIQISYNIIYRFIKCALQLISRTVINNI